MLKRTAAIAVALCAIIAADAALADTQWQKDHPRREQVNNRLTNQSRRIHNEVRQGDLTKSQGAQLHKQDHQIRQEERLMASQNGGHITKIEQATLNQQENRVGSEIGR